MTFSAARRPHFTLIELLVVIAIIGVLASILMPAIRRSHQQGQMMTCVGNLRNWGVAHHNYADDNDEWMPTYNVTPANKSAGYAGFEHYLEEYVGYREAAIELCGCPADAISNNGGTNSRPLSYRVNRSMSGWYANTQTRRPEVLATEKFFLMFCAPSTSRTADTAYSYHSKQGIAEVEGASMALGNPYSYIHDSGRRPTLFFDTHIDVIQNADIWPWPAGRPYWHKN